MTDGRPLPQVIELRACGPEDPDGSKAAAVLGAYFDAEHARAFRRLLWRRLAAMAIVWLLVTSVTSVLSRSAVFGGLAIIGACAVFAAVVGWRAEKHLSVLMKDQRPHA